MSVQQAARAIQGAYLRGSISYPRTEAQALSPASALLLAGSLPSAMQAPEWCRKALNEKIHRAEDAWRKQAGFAHESVHPTRQGIEKAPAPDVPDMMLDDEALTIRVLSEQWLSARINPEASGLPEWLGDLDFLPPAPRTIVPGIHWFSDEEAAHHALGQYSLGRPSTRPSHASKAASRKMVSSPAASRPVRNSLLDPSSGWLLDSIPPWLDDDFSRWLEMYIEQGQWNSLEDAMQDILSRLPAELAQQLMEIMRENDERPVSVAPAIMPEATAGRQPAPQQNEADARHVPVTKDGNQPPRNKPAGPAPG